MKKITLPFIGLNNQTTDEREYQFGAIFGQTSYTNSKDTTQNMSSGSNTWSIPKNLETIILNSPSSYFIGQFAMNGITARLYLPLTLQSHSAAFRYFNGKIYAQTSEFWIVTFPNINFNTSIIVYTNVKSMEENLEFIYYKTNNNEVVIEKYLGSQTAIAVPGTIDNLPVTAIEHYAYANKHLTSVTFPASLTFICERAFSDNNFTSLSPFLTQFSR